MTDRFSEDEVVAIITRLTRRQLVGFIESDFVRPERATSGYMFRRVDIARLELLCDLSIDMELDETALGIIISLLDQLHAARLELSTVARVIDTLPDDLQARIKALMKRA